MKIKNNFNSLFTFTISLVFLQFLSLSVISNNAENIYKQLTALQCDSLIKANEANPNFVILDVRTTTEWNGGHLLGSINRSTGLEDFEAQLDALPKQKLFLLHCQSGGRSAGAFTKMQNLGFSEVYEMKDGFNAWNSAGLPKTTTSEPKLMLVSSNEILTGGISDTVKITVTNRANGNLTFGTVSLTDIHEITNDFYAGSELAGAEDYTFSVIHTPGYSDDDTTKITIESNGGKIEINIVFKNGVIQSIDPEFQNELVIYPNPARNNIYFKNSSILQIEEVSFFNINGQMVLKENNFLASNGINISNLKSGVYFVLIKTKNQVFSKKLIIKS